MRSPLALIRAIVGPLRLESIPASIALWLAVTLQALAFGLSRYPPMIDYPQHVAMGALVRRLLDPSAPEHALYETNFFTYNAGIETAIGLLSTVMSAEAAGRLLFALYPFAFVVASLLLCHVAGRPKWYALLSVPLVYHYTCGWGFANFVLATPLAIFALVLWLRVLDEKRDGATLAALVVLSLVVAYTHVLVMLCLCVCVAVVSFWHLLDKGSTHSLARARQLVMPALTLIPSLAYSLGAWWWARRTSHTVWEHAWAEGQDEALWHKLRYLLFNATGNFSDASDQNLLLLAIALAVAIWLLSERGETHPRMRRLAMAFGALYCVVPKVFVATFHIYVRFLPFAALFAIASLPVVRDKGARWIALAASVGAIATGANLLVRFTTIAEVDDAMAMVDDVPEGRNLLMVTYDAAPKGYYREIWVHLPAIYQARKRGIIAYSFARNESPPIRYRADREPPRPPGGFEWDGRVYDPHASYAGYFDLVMVRTWLSRSGQQVDPAAHVFKDMASYAKLISRRGRFFLYDVSAFASARREPEGRTTRETSEVAARGDRGADAVSTVDGSLFSTLGH